ncbi:MAG: efflux RND transporter permease subunit [Desulfosarcinaceae bacterium]|nr:efflux RND transporter permease subunit [Desulfosarcinaceae bacterium]
MMHHLSAWFTRNPVAANLLMLLLLLGGAVTLQTMRIEAFPALPQNTVSITTLYPGATALQVDRGVTRKIEKALEGMAGIKKVSAFSEEGAATVWVEKVAGADMDRFENQVKTRIEALGTLPRQAERPQIARVEFKLEALLVQLYGDVQQATLQKSARELRRTLLAHPKIARIEAFGLLPYEIRIEVDDAKLRAYGLSIDAVAAAIDNASLRYTTGSIRSDAGEIILQADQQATSRREFAEIPVVTRPDGHCVRIGDLGRVTDGFAEEPHFARFQRRPSVGLQLFTSPKGHLPTVSRSAHQVVDDFRRRLPAGVEVAIWGESSPYIEARLALLADSAWQGLLIVFALLALFLNLKLAFWVAAGIPISLCGALILMGDRFLGHSLNDLTTFGMVIVLGILVDDAIVVGESVFQSRKGAADPIAGTIDGVRRVSTATVFGCFTTVAAFAPLLLMESDLGKIFASFAVVVVVALLVSLLESKLILPAHLAAVRIESVPPPSGGRLPLGWAHLQAVVKESLHRLNRCGYQPLLTVALRHRYATLVLFLAIAASVIGLTANGWIRTVFFPEVPGQIIQVEMEMAAGSPRHLTVANVTAIETAAEALNQRTMTELDAAVPPIAHLMSAITSPTSAILFAELPPQSQRPLSTLDTLRRWRAAVGVLEGVAQLSFSGVFETGGGFALEIAGDDAALLAAAVEDLKSALGQVAGISDLRDDLSEGSPRLRLRLRPQAHHLGLTPADLARQVGDGFGGLEVQRVQRGAEEIKVRLTFGADRRRYREDLWNTRIRTPDGNWLPLGAVATVESGYAPSGLGRQNGRQVVQVRAALETSRISATEADAHVARTIAPVLMARYPGITIRGAGELDEMEEMQRGLKRTAVVILVLIFSLLAVPLKSYWQPLVIMAVIPFGMVGVALGHWAMDQPLSVISFFGALALMGVVVNDSLVMLTRFNDLRHTGLDLQSALVQAGGSRFRAILLTTLTTVCGLLPLLAEESEQAQYLIPAAISLAWGELFATPITLVIIPVLIHCGEDLAACWRWLFGGRGGEGVASLGAGRGRRGVGPVASEGPPRGSNPAAVRSREGTGRRLPGQAKGDKITGAGFPGSPAPWWRSR